MAIKKTTSVSTKRKAITAEGELETSNDTDREQWIKDSAYYLAESRGFTPGHEREDWNIAENKYNGSFSSATP